MRCSYTSHGRLPACLPCASVARDQKNSSGPSVIWTNIDERRRAPRVPTSVFAKTFS